MNFNRSLGSYPGLLITVSLSVALFLIGFCGWIALSSKELIKYVKQNIEIQVYLDKELDANQVSVIKAQLSDLGIIDVVNNSSQIKYISKETASDIFFNETKEKFQDVLGDNPFRDSFSLKLKEEFINETKLLSLKTDLEKIPGVYEADYAKDFIKGIIANVNRIYKLLAVIVLIFFVATLLLINNTIKLALYSQRFIIRTMQLVGATDLFIQKPFLIKGLIQGFTASLISILLIFLTKNIAVNQIEGLSLIQNNGSLFLLFIVLLILGPVVGVLSTFQSIVRYHKMDLDKLY